MNDFMSEFDFLILAGDLPSAHHCLVRRVAPRLIIDEDWDTLRTILAKFGDNPEPQVGVQEWAQGGGIYKDFVHLTDSKQVTGTSKTIHRLQSALTSLNTKFADMGPVGQDKENLEERVALREMGRVVARMLNQEAAQARSVVDKVCFTSSVCVA
jgi:nuclear pore complex protein Nup98-Nup96